MFKKLIEAINEAEERELDESSFDMMMEDFDFDEELSEGFFSDFRAKRKEQKEARIKEHERRWTLAHNEANRIRSKFQSRIPADIKKYLDMDGIDTSDQENLTIFEFCIPDNIMDNYKIYNPIAKKIDEFIKAMQAETEFKIWMHADDEYHSIRVDSDSKCTLKNESENLSEGLFQRIKDRKNSYIEASRLRKIFAGKIPSDLRSYLDDSEIDDNNKLNNVIFNFAIPDKLAFKDSAKYDSLLDIMREFGKDIEEQTEFKTRVELSGDNSVQIKISSKRQ